MDTRQEYLDRIKTRLEFDEHPARQVLPAANGQKPLTVPMFPNWPLVRLNGIGIAYFSISSGGLSFIRRQPELVVEAVAQFCSEQHPATGDIIASQPPALPENKDD